MKNWRVIAQCEVSLKQLAKQYKGRVELNSKVNILTRSVNEVHTMTTRSSLANSLTKNITAVDLFCGAGGLTRGLRDAGVNVTAGYDIDPQCRHAYEHNNVGAKFILQSVKDVTKMDLAARYPKGHIRVLAGCAPCQPFSRYTRRNEPRDEEKWCLLNEFGRLIQEVRPEIVSMENVPELQRYRVFKDFLQCLEDEGYYFNNTDETRVLFCPTYGMPQNRKRLVLIASRLAPIELVPPTHKKSQFLTVSDVLRNLPQIEAGKINADDALHSSRGLSKINMKRIRASVPGGTWRDWPTALRLKCHSKEKGSTYPSVYGRMAWNQPSPTITTQFYGYGNGRFGHPEQNRALSLREGAVLQTFPTDYEFVAPNEDFSFNAIGRMIGNAVPVRLGEIIGQSILRHLKQQGHEVCI